MLGLSGHCDRLEGGNRKKKPFLSVTDFASNFPSLCAATAAKYKRRRKKNTKALIIQRFSIHDIPYKNNLPNHYYSETDGTYVYHLLVYSLSSELMHRRILFLHPICSFYFFLTNWQKWVNVKSSQISVQSFSPAQLKVCKWAMGLAEQ